jgi:diguanylate cyclase (GGDEF)-like protein
LTALAVPLVLATAAPQLSGFGFRDVVVLGLLLLGASALFARLPWTSHDERWLGLIAAVQIVAIASLTTMTGGGASPYFALYAPVLALAGWYLRGDLVVAAVTLVAATEIWRAAAIEGGGSAEQVTIALPFYAGLAAISWLTAHRLATALVTVRHDQVRTAAVLVGVEMIGANPTDDPLRQLVIECERIFGSRAGIVTFQDGDPIAIDQAVPMTGGGGYLRIPVRGARGNHALLQLWRDHSFSANEVRLAGILAGAAAKAADARWLLDRLREESERDSVTGLLNRRAFDRHVTELLARTTDGAVETTTTLFVVEVDAFAAWNDANGDAEGDRLLERLGEGLLSVVRSRDGVYRLGFDRFAIVACGLTPDEATAFAARLSTMSAPAHVRRADDRLPNAADATVRLSVGVAHAAAVTDPADLLRAADLAMDAAKPTVPSATGLTANPPGTDGPTNPTPSIA